MLFIESQPLTLTALYTDVNLRHLARHRSLGPHLTKLDVQRMMESSLISISDFRCMVLGVKVMEGQGTVIEGILVEGTL